MYYLISSTNPHRSLVNKSYSLKAETFQELKEQIPAYLESLYKRRPGFKDKILPGLEIVAYENFDYYLIIPFRQNWKDPEARKGMTFQRQTRIDRLLAGLIYCVIRGWEDTFKRIFAFNWSFSWNRFINKPRDLKADCYWGDMDQREIEKVTAERRAAAHNITLNNDILNTISK